MKLEEPEDRISVRARAWMGEARRTFRRFEQDKVWVDAHGEEWEIDRLETSHLLHIIPFLERKAHRLAYLHGFGALQLAEGPLGPTPGSEAERMVEESLQEMWELQIRDPLKWLRSTPLMKRLYQEKKKRENEAREQATRADRRRPLLDLHNAILSHVDREVRMENLLAEVLDTMNRRVWFPHELRNRIAEELNAPKRG
jgi:hypothetical protein